MERADAPHPLPASSRDLCRLDNAGRDNSEACSALAGTAIFHRSGMLHDHFFKRQADRAT